MATLTKAEQDAPVSKLFRFTLPTGVGMLGFLVYCATLNHWASLSNIGTIARVAGWTWQPELRQPLTCALLYTFRLLPVAWLPFALNFFTAACAALVLAALARSVSLLDAAAEKPQAHSGSYAAWAPPVLSVAICGLQLSFWEHATSFSGEIIDLLIFAYVIRCLLEFRNDQRESWLFRSAFIYSAGMANNWAMIGYLPLYAVAVLFVKGFGLKRVTRPLPPRKPPKPPQWLRQLMAKLGFRQNAMPRPVYPTFRPVVFDTRFFWHMILWGLAGLSFYFLLPVIQTLSLHSTIGFWAALKANLRFQVNFLGILRSPAFRILVVASLLPILVLILGWKSQPANSGYESRRGIFLNRLAAYPLHAIVLFIALWLSFDPVFGPRHLALSVPMLTYYYLTALAGGYCAAYFLRISAEGSVKAIAKSVTAVICVLAVAVPLLLASKNLSQILVTNGKSLHQFARELYEDLPDGKEVVFGNDPVQLSLLRAEMAAQHGAKDALIVEMPSLGSAQYHVAMVRRYGSRWHVIPPTNNVDLVGPIKLLKLISAFAEHEPVVYFDPTFGPLFDRPADPVNGFIHRFAITPENAENTNEQLWQKRWADHLQSLAEFTKLHYQDQSRPGTVRLWLSKLKLEAEPNPTISLLRAIYSRSLNNWGVRAQRLGHWSEAGVWFQHSLDLNPQNLSAHINFEFNGLWQRGQKKRLEPAAIQKQFAEIFSRYNDWREVLNDFGSVDEPTFLFRTGRAFLANGNIRLAANTFRRSAELAPDWPLPNLWLAQSLVDQGNFTEALRVTDRLQNSSIPEEGPTLAQLLHCRTTSLRALGRTNEITGCIGSYVREHGQHAEVLAVAANAYAQNGMHEQELATVEELIKREPNQPEWLSQKGIAEMQLGRYEAAIATLTSALSLVPADENARLSRAIAHLGADQLDAAREDYEQLLGSPNSSANALFGLGTVAWRKHETNVAISYYQQYLTNAMPRFPQATIASQRLREMGAR